MRIFWSVAAAIAVMGCSGPVPDSGNTVFLQPVTPEARAQRDRELQGVRPAAGTVGLQPVNAPAIQATNPNAGASASQTSAAASPAAASYNVVTPKAVPSRPANSGPSVAGFALATSHPVGQPVYSRSSASTDRSARACARYASDDLAQAAFLQTGGPEADGQGLDPDGDGYACAWDPERFRQAIR